MPEIISQSLELAKEHGLGVSGAAWIVGFASVAWLAGKSGVGAVKFVRGLLETSSELRERILKELNETRSIQQRSNEKLVEQAGQIAMQGAIIEDLRNKLRDAEYRVQNLLDDLRREREHRRR